jgi:hypothetical protein
LIEIYKSDKDAIVGWLNNFGYAVIDVSINVLAIHATDKCLALIQQAKVAAA